MARRPDVNDGILATPVSVDDSASGGAGRFASTPAGSTRRTVRMRLWRGDADGGTFKEYELPANEGEVVLDVVHRIQADQAPDLAVRWNCKAGKCGSCSAEVNGRPSLMCMTRMSSLPPDETVTVSPMRGFPIVRDLVSDVSFNYEVAKRIPAFKPGPREADGTYRMQQIDIDRVQEFHKCIECFLCQNVCHVIRDHEGNKRNYAGPRFFVRLAALEMHPLDTNDRRALIREMHGIGLCNITKCCTEVCPEHIHITDNAIIPLKERVVDMRYDPIAWLGRKLRRQQPPKPAQDTYRETPAYRASVATAPAPAEDDGIVSVHSAREEEPASAFITGTRSVDLLDERTDDDTFDETPVEVAAALVVVEAPPEPEPDGEPVASPPPAAPAAIFAPVRDRPSRTAPRPGPKRTPPVRRAQSTLTDVTSEPAPAPAPAPGPAPAPAPVEAAPAPAPVAAAPAAPAAAPVKRAPRTARAEAAPAPAPAPAPAKRAAKAPAAAKAPVAKAAPAPRAAKAAPAAKATPGRRARGFSSCSCPGGCQGAGQTGSQGRSRRQGSGGTGRQARRRQEGDPGRTSRPGKEGAGEAWRTARLSTSGAVGFLSREWLEALSELVPTGESALRLGQIVTGAPGGDVAYTIYLGGGEAGKRVVPGSVSDAEVVLVETYDTALGLASGALTTADAVRRGLIKVRGAAKQLAANEELLVSLGEALAELRSRTEF